MTPAELQAAVDAIPYFYHRIELPHGIITPGWAPMNPAAYRIPEDMTGMRVLDVGAWDGYWTFEALKRGADEVVATDDFSDTCGKLSNADRTGGFRTLHLCAQALGFTKINDSANRQNTRWTKGEQQLWTSWFDICKPDVLSERYHDYIFAFGLLYHLKDPFLALRNCFDGLRPGGTIHIETAILDGCKSAYGDYGYSGDECLFEFYPHDEYGMNQSNWFVGTLKAWAAMVEAAGFTDIETWKLVDQPRTLAEARGFIRAKT